MHTFDYHTRCNTKRGQSSYDTLKKNLLEFDRPFNPAKENSFTQVVLGENTVKEVLQEKILKKKTERSIA